MATNKVDVVVFVCGRFFRDGHGDGRTKSNGKPPFDDDQLYLSKTNGIKYKTIGVAEDQCQVVVVDEQANFGEVRYRNGESVERYLNRVGDAVSAVLKDSGCATGIAALNKLYVCSHFGGGLVDEIAQHTLDLQKTVNELRSLKKEGIWSADIRVYNMSGTWRKPDFLYEGGLSAVKGCGRELMRNIESAIKHYEKVCAWKTNYNLNMGYALNWCHTPSDVGINDRRDSGSAFKSSLIIIAAADDDDGQAESVLKSLSEQIEGRADLRVVLVSPRGVARCEYGFCEDGGSGNARSLIFRWRPSVDEIRELQHELEGPIGIYCFNPAEWHVFDAILSPWVLLSHHRQLFVYCASPNDAYVLERLLVDACAGSTPDAGDDAKVEVKLESELDEKLSQYYDDVMTGVHHG